MYERILVPLDGSSLAEKTLPHAAAQAEKFGSEIVLLKVLGPLQEPSTTGRPAFASAQAATAQLAQDYWAKINAKPAKQPAE